ncbi:hypothetical protein F5887DRAFT_1078188 [Amanita rubescens]|nr:hypothetical protein F5887DRAFT_1078188 [Amanita rubescens]
MTPQGLEDFDFYLANLATPTGSTKMNSSEAPLWQPSVFQLPDDLFSITSSAEDDLVSVLLRDIQSSNFDNRIGDVPSICDFLDTEFSHEFDVHDVLHYEDKEINASVPSAVTAAVDTACQFPEVASDETLSAETVHNAVSRQSDVTGHHAARDQSSVNSDEERTQRGIIDASVPAKPPHGREISPPLSRPQTRRSNQRPTDSHAATHPPLFQYHNADTSDMGAPSLQNMHEEHGGVDEHPPSPTRESAHIPDTPPSKPQIWLKPRLIKTPAGCEVADATSPTFHPAPVQYHLLPIRGRPRGSKTGGKQNQTNASSSSGLGDAPQPFDYSAPTTTLDSTTEKQKKARAKPKKVVQPNPYPDLSKYPARGEKRTNDDISTPRSPTASSCGSDSIIGNTTFLHSIGSPPTMHYPLSIPDDPGFFVLTNAEWDDASQALSARPYAPTCRGDRFLCSSNETSVPEGSLVYPVLMPPGAPSSSLTASTDTSCGKRKRVMDDNELVETKNSHKRWAVKASSSSRQGLYGNRVAAISSTPMRSISIHQSPMTKKDDKP